VPSLKLAIVVLATSWLSTVAFSSLAPTAVSGPLTPMERLGRLLFFDTSLSARRNQSCASCHAPEAGWVGRNETFNKSGGVYEGSIGGRFGSRKPPSAAYATFAPSFTWLPPHHGGLRHHGGSMGHAMARRHHQAFLGGNFWDGRATGEKLGSPAADQAMAPFLNPAEQALPDAGTLVERVCAADYARLFKEVWGQDACGDVDRAYGSIALSLAAFEGSSAVNQFSSKYDAVLAGRAQLTSEESSGLQLFGGKAGCAACHPHRPSRGGPPLFTDFTFDNLGLPANPANPFYRDTASNPKGTEWRDEGLGGFLKTSGKYAGLAADHVGKHRVPTLRNVDLRPAPAFVKAYGHNGYFTSLEAIVHFYNTRDVLPTCGGRSERPGVDCWPAPEIAANINRVELGSLRLTAEEEAAIVAFLGTLSDGYAPPRGDGPDHVRR
jgi:cytochrome c peroxidase